MDVEITVASSPDYERLVAEIYVSGAFIGLLSEETPGVRVFESERGIKLPAADLISAISAANARLDLLDQPRPT